jgi:integrase
MLEKRVTKDGKTRWRVLIRIKGHPPVSRTFGSKTKARQWEEKARTEIRENRFFEQLEAERHTFAEMIDRYLEQRLPRKSPVMQRHQRHQLLWWKEKIGHHRLSDVSPALIAQTRDELAAITVGSKAKKQRSGASVNRYLAALSHVFSVATREWGWLLRSPMDRVERLPEARGRVRYLDDEERKRLLSACEKSRDLLLYPLVLTALSTGCRQGELLNLRWSEVDLERGVIRLLNTKNNERRAVPLHGPARDQVLALSKVRRIGDDRVFPLTSHQLRGPWQAALRQAEIEDFRFHDLRHTAASYLAMSGATLAEIAEVLGHKSLQMVRRYSHISEQHTSEVIERMTTKVFGGG